MGVLAVLTVTHIGTFSKNTGRTDSLPIPAGERSTYRITLRPGPGVDGIKALRGALKILGRRFGMTAVAVEEIKPQTERGGIAPLKEGDDDE
jgi:hypothetical protein